MKGIFDQDMCFIFHFSKARLRAAHHGLMAHNAAPIKQLFGINQINLPMPFSRCKLFPERERKKEDTDVLLYGVPLGYPN